MLECQPRYDLVIGRDQGDDLKVRKQTAEIDGGQAEFEDRVRNLAGLHASDDSIAFPVLQPSGRGISLSAFAEVDRPMTVGSNESRDPMQQTTPICGRNPQAAQRGIALPWSIDPWEFDSSISELPQRSSFNTFSPKRRKSNRERPPRRLPWNSICAIIVRLISSDGDSSERRPKAVGGDVGTRVNRAYAKPQLLSSNPQ